MSLENALPCCGAIRWKAEETKSCLISKLIRSTMNSTTRFHSKPKPEAFASPFESRLGEATSPITSTSTSRRSARRWARKPLQPPADNQDDSDDSGKQTDATPSSAPLHPVENIVASLIAPPLEVEEQKTAEYEWYIHYPSDPASHSVEMTDEKDLALYLRQSRLASGEDVERVLIGGASAGNLAAPATAAAMATGPSDIERIIGLGMGVIPDASGTGAQRTGLISGVGVEEEERRAGFYDGWLRAAA